MKILSFFFIVTLFIQYDVSASWYGCPQYKNHELENMSENELRDAKDKNIKLSEEIYEDAAVQSILDKRIYHFRSQQYMDCIKYIEEIDRIIKKRFPESEPVEQ